MSCNDTGCGIDDQCSPDQVRTMNIRGALFI